MPGWLVRCGVAALLFMATSAVPALADAAGEQAIKDFVARIDAAAEWSAKVGSVRSEGDDTIGEQLVISRQDPEISFALGSLRLGGFHKTVDGGFAASTVALQGLAVAISSDIGGTAQTIAYEVPTVSVEGVSFPDTGSLTFDPQHPLRFIGELYTLLATIEFDSYSVPEVSGTQTVVAAGQAKPVVSTFSYRDITSTGMHGGVIRQSGAGPVSIDIDAPEAGGTIHVGIDEAMVRDLDVGALAHILDPRAYQDGRGDGVWRSILSDARYSGLSGTAPDGTTVTLDSMAISGFDGHQPETPFADAFDALLDPSIPDADKEKTAVTALLALYEPWRLGSFEIGPLSVSVPDRASFELGGFSLAGMSKDGIDRLSLSALRGSGREGFGKLDSLEIGGFVFPDVRKLVAMKEAGKLDDPGPEDIRAIFAAMSRVEHFGLHGLAAGRSKMSLVTLGDFTIDLADWNDIFAASSEIKLSDLTIPRELLERDPKGAEMFRALGYDTLKLGASFTHHWSADTGADDARLSLSVGDGGEMEASYAITGLTGEWIDRIIAAAQAHASDPVIMNIVSRLRLVRAGFSIADASLVDRALAAAIAGKRLDVDVETYRRQLQDAVTELFPPQVPSLIAERLAGPLRTFLEGGHTLAAAVAPAPPIGLPELVGGAVIDPIGLMDRLKLTISAE